MDNIEDVMLETNDNIQYVIELENKISELENKIKDNDNKYLYLLSDMQNMKRQYENKIARNTDETTDKVVNKFIEILTDLNKAAIYNTENDNDITQQAIDIILKKFYNVLSSFNIEEFDPIGEVFDDKTMNGISIIPTDDDTKDGIVASVFNVGYKNTKTDKVIKYADVVIYKYNS